MLELDYKTLLESICSRVLNVWQTLTGNTKRVIVTIITCSLLGVTLLLIPSCGITRTTVRTSGKGTTNATVSVTTNNPTSVDVSTQIDSIPVRISSKRNRK